MIKKIWDKVMNREVISYLIFGVLTTLVNWVVYAAMVKVHIDYRIATAAAWAVSVLFAFIVNKIFVFQSYNLVPVLNVYENIVLPIELDGNKVDKAYVNELIEILGIGEKLQNLPGQLSGGQQQRVAIARALAAKPAIVLADEPTGNLDSRTSQDVLGLLKVTGEKFGQTIVMITHNPDLAQLADRIVRIEDGMILNRKECEANA